MFSLSCKSTSQSTMKSQGSPLTAWILQPPARRVLCIMLQTHFVLVYMARPAAKNYYNQEGFSHCYALWFATQPSSGGTVTHYANKWLSSYGTPVRFPNKVQHEFGGADLGRPCDHARSWSWLPCGELERWDLTLSALHRMSHSKALTGGYWHTSIFCRLKLWSAHYY